MMFTFKQSPVLFDEENHKYMLGDKQLLGITGLIHSILGLGVYPDANDYTADFAIPRAGSRGTAVHHAIQTYDLLGVKQTNQVVRTKYGCEKRNNIQYVDETWDVGYELECYIHNLTGYKPLANELTVSDNEKWASQIDNVWLNEKTGGIWLADTKTNNIDLYPLVGYFIKNYFRNGEEALKEYLSWQLSVYAYLFEEENPGLKVEGLACNWLRKDKSDFWIIERKPTELVKELLSSDYIITDNGPVYFHYDQTVFGIGKNVPERSSELLPIIPDDAVTYFAGLLKTVKETEDKLDEAKTALKMAMLKHGVNKYDFGLFSASLSADSTSTSFDSKKFKAEYPEMYEKYTKQTTRKGSLLLKLKDND